jgi:hypothetical protein
MERQPMPNRHGEASVPASVDPVRLPNRHGEACVTPSMDPVP